MALGGGATFLRRDKDTSATALPEMILSVGSGFARCRDMRRKSTQKTIQNGKVQLTRHDARLVHSQPNLLLVIQRSVNSRAVSNQFADFPRLPIHTVRSHRVWVAEA